jgi:hypothetical protein
MSMKTVLQKGAHGSCYRFLKVIAYKGLGLLHLLYSSNLGTL